MVPRDSALLDDHRRGGGAHRVRTRCRTATPPFASTPTLVLLAGAVAVSVACVAFAVRPAIANARYAAALTASGQRPLALHDIAEARQDDPSLSEYAAFQGDLEADLVGDRPGPYADLPAARNAYQDAIAEGDFFPAVGIRLAYVDIALGDPTAALAAAETARNLDPYGLAGRLVQELGGVTRVSTRRR